MASVSTATVSGEERIRIEGLNYEFYKQFCDAIGEQPVRLSFDSETLEIMITKSPHEFYKGMLAKLIELTIFELNIPVRTGGSMTFQRDDLKKGFEPDECWWIETEPLVRGKREFDFRHDPPPDLAVEIEVSRSQGTRMRIYAALGIKEVWRFNEDGLKFLRLDANKCCEPIASSMALPILRPEHLFQYLDLDDARDETTRLRAFRDWLVEQIKVSERFFLKKDSRPQLMMRLQAKSHYQPIIARTCRTRNLDVRTDSRLGGNNFHRIGSIGGDDSVKISTVSEASLSD